MGEGAAGWRPPADGRRRHYALSGGRPSAYLVHHVVEACGGLPEGAACIFTNTGREREETLDFVQRCAQEWRIEVVWLEYRYRGEASGRREAPRHHYERVAHATASRAGEPFEQMVRAAGRLPTAVQRRCTQELKRRTAERYLARELGWPRPGSGGGRTRTVVGIRYDEPRRWRGALMEQCAMEYPLVEMRVDQAEVARFWSTMPFDLALPPSGGGWSNCDLCFLKGERRLRQLVAAEPRRALWWAGLEAELARGGAQGRLRDPGKARFSDRFSYAELYRDAVEGRQGRLAIDGPAADCWCTD